ncbi:hypothetical protein AHF37_00803 [Paragonimus kellicotti]|nr:hypothetical protein AHF37_00803 [Paragonimus kellicotti]
MLHLPVAKEIANDVIQSFLIPKENGSNPSPESGLGGNNSETVINGVPDGSSTPHWANCAAHLDRKSSHTVVPPTSIFDVVNNPDARDCYNHSPNEVFNFAADEMSLDSSAESPKIVDAAGKICERLPNTDCVHCPKDDVSQLNNGSLAPDIGPSIIHELSSPESRIHGAAPNELLPVPTHQTNAAAFHPELAYVTGRGVQARGVRAQDRVSFQIHTERCGEQAQVQVSMVRSDGEVERVSVEQVSGHLWNCTYVPQRPGKYSLRVLYGGGDVQNSPFDVFVGPHIKSSIKAYGSGLFAGVVNNPNIFTVACQDQSSKIGE